MVYTFEDKYNEITKEIEARRKKWDLNYPEFDDISQMIQLHIWKKWKYWEQNIPFEKFLKRIVCFQFRACKCYYKFLQLSLEKIERTVKIQL